MIPYILITGASSGIGRDTAIYLSEKGYGVILVARREKLLDDLKCRLKSKVLIFSYDLKDLEHIENIFIFCQKNNIRLDGMVHCAGISRDMPIRLNDLADMKEVMDVNCFSFIELEKYFYNKKYSNNNASIIAISSVAVYSNVIGMCTYTASKAALNSAVKIMAKEFCKRKIRVNAILPSYVNTQMVEDTKQYVEDLESRLSGFGVIEPVYISYMVEYLLSEKAKYITGTEIPITSG